MVGGFGHIIRARALVLLGIVIVGAACILFFASAASNEGSSPPARLPQVGSN